MKKMEKKKDTSSGFTLIELLAVIAILSVVISIGIYVAISVIGKSKEKSYEATIENIENITNDYLIEKSNELFFVALATSNDLEYQCIQVKNLVDMGYFDNDIVDSLVSEDDTVSLDDYIYVERNISSKTINRTKYLYDKEMVEYASCDIARIISGYVYFNLKPIDWSREKDLVINYVLKNDLNKSNYSYEYSYLENGEEKIGKVTDNSNSKKLVIKENGNVLAYIYDKDRKKIADASINISKIDRVGPEINVSYEGDYYVGNNVNIPFIVTDVGSGVDYSSFTLDDIIVKINNVEIKDGLTFIDNGNGKFNLNIVNNNYHGDLDIIINADRVYDKVENGNSLKEFKDILVFDNVPPTCRLSVTTSGVTFDKKEDNGEIYSYGMNMTGEAVYDKTDNLELDEGTFYGYVKDTAGNVGSCSAKITKTEVSEYTKTTKTCKNNPTYTCRKVANSSNSCPNGYAECDSSKTYPYDCECYSLIAGTKVGTCNTGYYPCEDGYDCECYTYKSATKKYYCDTDNGYSKCSSSSDCQCYKWKYATTSCGDYWKCTSGYNCQCYYSSSAYLNSSGTGCTSGIFQTSPWTSCFFYKSYTYTCSGTGWYNGYNGYCYKYDSYDGYTYSCPDYYTNTNDGNCWHYKDYSGYDYECPAGYYKMVERCFIGADKETTYSCSSGTNGNDGYCYKYNQTSCSSDFKKYNTNNNYSFSSSSEDVTSCSVETSFGCNGNNVGEDYVSSCTPKSYSCSSESETMLNNDFCYVLD